MLTVTPSTTVDVDQFVTLQCRSDPNPIPPVVMKITINGTTHCTLETDNGVCKNPDNACAKRYTSACPNETFFTVQIQVLKNWNGASINCATLYVKSNTIVFDVKGMCLTIIFFLWFNFVHILACVILFCYNFVTIVFK